MDAQQEREREWMERWSRRGRWWRETVIGDFAAPTIGVGGIVALWLAGVSTWEPYAACLALVTAPAVGAAAEAVQRRREPPE